MVSVKVAALSSAFQKTAQDVVGPRNKKPEILLVDRTAKNHLLERMNANVIVVIEEFGYPPEERDRMVKELTAQALSGFQNLPKVDPLELLAHIDSTLIWTLENGRKELKAVTEHNVVNKLEEASQSLREVENLADWCSDLACNNDHNLEQWHETMSKKRREHGGKVNLISFLDIAGDWHWNDDDWQKDATKVHDVQAVRSYMSNRALLRQRAYEQGRIHVEGLLRQDLSIAKMLDLDVVSIAALTGTRETSWINERVVSRSFKPFDTLVPLAVTKRDTEPDGVLERFEKRLRRLEQVETERQWVKTTRVYANITLRDVAQSVFMWENNYVFPFFPLPPGFTKEGIAGFEHNRLTLMDAGGSRLEFGDEVLSVEVKLVARLGELSAFWSIDARPSAKKRNQVEIMGLGFKQDSSNHSALAKPAEPTIAVELLIKYRER